MALESFHSNIPPTSNTNEGIISVALTKCVAHFRRPLLIIIGGVHQVRRIARTPAMDQIPQ